MALTIQTLIDNADGTTFDNAVTQLRDTAGNGLGAFLRSFVPSFKVRSGLASLAIHIETAPGTISAVLDLAGANELLKVYVGVAGAGEVLIVYSTAGVPTLTFGDGVNTGYQVLKQELPLDWAAALAAVGA